MVEQVHIPHGVKETWDKNEFIQGYVIDWTWRIYHGGYEELRYVTMYSTTQVIRFVEIMACLDPGILLNKARTTMKAHVAESIVRHQGKIAKPLHSPLGLCEPPEWVKL